MPSSSELNEMLDAGMIGCIIATGGLLLAGGVGFFLVLLKGQSIFRSCQFAVVGVMLALFFPAICGVSTYVAYGATTSFVDNAVKTDGVVVGLEEERMSEGRTGYSAVVEFTPVDSATPIQFVDGSEVCDPACKDVGDEVTVIYNSDNAAESARIDNPLTTWIWPAVFGLMAVIFLLVALFYIVRSYRTGRYWELFDNLLE